MSNARYFADGVDFWRVIYEDDSTDGPYISPYSATGVGKNAIKVRSVAPNWTKRNGQVVQEWQEHTSYRLQKLGIVRNECDGSLTACTPGLCFGGHGSRLDWEDWSA